MGVVYLEVPIQEGLVEEKPYGFLRQTVASSEEVPVIN